VVRLDPLVMRQARTCCGSRRGSQYLRLHLGPCRTGDLGGCAQSIQSGQHRQTRCMGPDPSRRRPSRGLYYLLESAACGQVDQPWRRWTSGQPGSPCRSKSTSINQVWTRISTAKEMAERTWWTSSGLQRQRGTGATVAQVPEPRREPAVDHRSFGVGVLLAGVGQLNS
jgi:hypothetical protein